MHEATVARRCESPSYTLLLQLNDKFGLPPIGLPPKKWFGLNEEELIVMRHKMLNEYIKDCLKRPVSSPACLCAGYARHSTDRATVWLQVLIHSRELQSFVEMPPDVRSDASC